jgi:hypothetical protein
MIAEVIRIAPISKEAKAVIAGGFRPELRAYNQAFNGDKFFRACTENTENDLRPKGIRVIL